ncbi:MAG: twin-arginine translocation signal domain-containing protein [Burkholderiales bacterium]
MQRRDFVKLCAGGAATAVAAPFAFAEQKGAPHFYDKARLLDESGKPVKAASLKANTNYIFHYPFQGTPCFLLNLDKPTQQNIELKTADGKPYLWKGGVGGQKSIVAYSAICAHRLNYPTKQLTFISFRDKKSEHATRENIIHCCSEHSEYDPAAGAKVISGPAPQPLAAILLEHDAASDGLVAVGTFGGEMFNEFFHKFEFKLGMEHGGKAQMAVATATVSELTTFCKQQIQC